MIVDVLDGDLYFHSVGIIRRIIKNSQKNHFYLIKVTSEKYKKIYEEIFSENNYINYKICSVENNVTTSPLILRVLCWLRKNKTSNAERGLLTEIYRHRKDILLIHGNLLTPLCVYFLLLNRWSNLNWICWGWIVDKHETGSWKIIVNNFCISILYRKFKRIICLMLPDVKKIKEIHKCRRVFLCPYPRDFKNVCQSDISNPLSNKILIGNSSHAVYTYISFTEKLIPYKDRINLTYMIPYGAEYLSAVVDKLKKILKEEGFKYDFWDKILPYNEYEKKICEYQIYVCPYDTQTGLGAIYNMIENKATVYLTGFNFEWLSFLGIKVYSVEDFVDKIKKRQSFDIDINIKEQNKTLLKNLFDGKRRIEKLEQLLFSNDVLGKDDFNWL